MTNILLVGSYNGQDSFGDKGLLRCVTTQFRSALGEGVQFTGQIYENLQEARRVAPDVEFHLGIMRLLWQWHGKLRHLHVPPVLQLCATILTLPIWLVASKQNRHTAAAFLEDVRQCSLLYFYGGTQLSGQWFRLNFPPLVLTAVLARLFGKPVYFGPQQYGPESASQARLLRFFVRCLVSDVRVRNTACQALLQLPDSKLLFDEIFSCTKRFPISTKRVRQQSFLLVNMRASNFLRDMHDKEFRAFAQLLVALHKRLGISFKLFQMSGSSFSDDTLVQKFLEAEGLTAAHVEIMPTFEQERQLVELAEQAYGTVSMSFHGCVLSMLGGCPAVPVTSEGYYDYKYVDFDRYTGFQRVPLVSLARPADQQAPHILEYFENYDPRLVARIREEAGLQMQAWYRQIANARSLECSIGR